MNKNILNKLNKSNLELSKLVYEFLEYKLNKEKNKEKLELIKEVYLDESWKNFWGDVKNSFGQNIYEKNPFLQNAREKWKDVKNKLANTELAHSFRDGYKLGGIKDPKQKDLQNKIQIVNQAQRMFANAGLKNDPEIDAFFQKIINKIQNNPQIKTESKKYHNEYPRESVDFNKFEKIIFENKL